MKTIAEVHAEWAKAVVPAGAGQIQRQEMERSFYGGFAAALKAFRDAADEAGDDEEAGAQLLAGLEEQCIEFVMNMMAQHLKKVVPC